MPWHITLLFIVAVLNALFSLILLRGARSPVNTIFSIFVLSAAAWSVGIGLFLFNANDVWLIHIANFYYIAAGLIPVVFLYFSLLFLSNKERIPLYKHALALIPVVIFLIGLLLNKNLIILSIHSQTWGKDVVLNRAPYAIYGALFIVYVITAYMNLYLRLWQRKDGAEKLQLKFVIYGTIVPYILGMTFNLFLPWQGNYEYIWLGPAFSLMMVAAIAYAVAKHHLFNPNNTEGNPLWILREKVGN